MVFLGVNWVIIPTNFNTATQKSVPLWVKGRAISFYLTVLFGSFTVGAAIWGPLTKAHNIHFSLLVGGLSMAALLTLAKWFPLTLNEGLDLNAAFAGAPPTPVLPDIAPPLDPVAGPTPVANGQPAVLDYAHLAGAVEVSFQYDIHPTKVAAFLDVMSHVGRQRQRNGASAWRLEPTAFVGNGMVTYLEMIRYRSRAEFYRQPARMTKADLELLKKASALHTGAGPLPGRSEMIPSGAARPLPRQTAAAAGPVPLNSRLASVTGQAFDRLFDEVATVCDRFSALRQRDRARRASRHREIWVKIYD